MAMTANRTRWRRLDVIPKRANNGIPQARTVSLKLGDIWAMVGALVAVTVRVTVDAPVPARFTVAGLKLHTAGELVQPNTTGPEKPPSALILSWVDTLPPEVVESEI